MTSEPPGRANRGKSQRSPESSFGRQGRRIAVNQNEKFARVGARIEKLDAPRHRVDAGTGDRSRTKIASAARRPRRPRAAAALAAAPAQGRPSRGVPVGIRGFGGDCRRNSRPQVIHEPQPSAAPRASPLVSSPKEREYEASKDLLLNAKAPSILRSVDPSLERQAAARWNPSRQRTKMPATTMSSSAAVAPGIPAFAALPAAPLPNNCARTPRCSPTGARR